MPICSLANLLLAAGVPKISPSTLPSLDFTFRPSVLAGAAAAVAFELEAAGAAAAFEPVAAGGGASVFLLDAQPKSKPRHAAETSSLLGIMCQVLCNSSSVVVIVFIAVMVPAVVPVLAASLQHFDGGEHAACRRRHAAGDAGLHQPHLFGAGVFAQQQAVRYHSFERAPQLAVVIGEGLVARLDGGTRIAAAVRLGLRERDELAIGLAAVAGLCSLPQRPARVGGP